MRFDDGDTNLGPILRFSKPCNRCRSIQIDPNTGTVEDDKKNESGGIMRTLKSFRLVYIIVLSVHCLFFCRFLVLKAKKKAMPSICV